MDPQTSPPPLPSLPNEPPVSGPPQAGTPATTPPIAASTPSVEQQTSARQQAIERLKNAANVLVTVSTDPSVDELSSALGLTLLFDKLGKHATTVFSGSIPRAIEFLDPAATFEENVDSLRDFIIALDKEKADKLRYKVEDDVVRIFITPYKTKISEADLQFSQGDFNVDVVVALGVIKREDLDKSITAHGRILHDATVITVNAGEVKSNLGSIDWHDPKASSVAEMLMSASESFGSGLLDSQISTAFLTGIVAATNRFSNEKTSPKVMTMSAQLMAAGANQQLIASNLRQDGVLSESVRNPGDDHASESEMVVEHKNQPTKKSQEKGGATKPQQAKSTSDTVRQKPQGGPNKPQSNQNTTSKSVNSPDQKTKQPVDFPPKKAGSQSEPTDIGLSDDLKKQLETPETTNIQAQEVPQPEIQGVKIESSQAPEPVAKPELESSPVGSPAIETPFNATMASVQADAKEAERRDVNMTSAPPQPVAPPSLPSTPAVEEKKDEALDAEKALEEARKAVENATEAQPFDPANKPLEAMGAHSLPSLDHSPKAAGTPTIDTSAPSGDLPSIELPSQPTLPSLQPLGQPDTGVSSVQQQAQNTPFGTPRSEESEDGPDPMSSFMSTHQNSTIQPLSAPPSVPQAPQDISPTTPGMSVPPPFGQTSVTPGSSEAPPLPPLPGQPNDPTVAFKPDVQPAFMQGMQPTENSWTKAADDLAAKKQAEGEKRQEKLDQISTQYDVAVDRNRELQGLPPINDDHGTFPLPPPPPSI